MTQPGAPAERLGPVPGERIGFGATATVYAWGEGQVLKLFIRGMSEVSIREEAEATAAAHAMGLPVPAMHGVLDLDGRPGIVYERVSGPTLLQRLCASPWRLWHLASRLAELQAGLHGMATDRLPPLRRRLRWQIEHVTGLPTSTRDEVLHLLDAMPDGDRVCHWDFHPDNVIVTARGPVIIDWMGAARGDAAADHARSLVVMGLSEPPAGRTSAAVLRLGVGLFVRRYRQRYRQLVPTPADRVAAWQIVVAAARLRESRPPAECERLKRLVADGLSRL